MSSYIGIALLGILPGILSGIVQIFLASRMKKGIHKGKIIIGYIGLFYGVLSFVKMLFDGGEATLAESFKDILPATYLHYMVPIIVLIVVLPCLISLVFYKFDNSRFFVLFDSLMFGMLALIFIVFNRINHVCYVCALIISVLIALAGTCWYKGEIVCCSKYNIKKRIKYAAPVVLFYVVTVILSVPGTLFLNNRSEIPIIFSAFTIALLIGAFTFFFLLVGAGIWLLTRKQFELFYTVLFALTLMGYFQSMLLNGHMAYMDGKVQKWGNAQIFGNAFVWFLAVMVIVIIKMLLHKDVGKFYGWVCVYLSLVQVASLGYLVISTNIIKDTENYNGEWTLSTDGALELHPDNNVLVFVLDWYDEQLLETILKENEDFLEPLDGFTYYTNAASPYAFTEMAVPYLLTGIEWQYNMDEIEYRKYAFDHGTVLEDIARGNYSIGVYTDLEYVGESVTDKLCNYVPCRAYCRMWDTVDLMMKCSKYQMAPFGVKNLYWYATSEIAELSEGEAFSDWDINRDIPFWTALNETGISIDRKQEKEGNFRFYHMFGAHMPYHMTENCTKIKEGGDILSQSKGCLKIVFEYIRQLKEIGLYDDATIIITADHGQNYIYDPVGVDFLPDLGLENTSNPILLVKNSGEKMEGIKTSHAQVSHTEVIASVINAVDPQVAKKYGRTLQEIGDDEERERIFVFTRGDLPYVKAVINGDVRNKDDWSVVDRIEVEDKQ